LTLVPIAFVGPGATLQVMATNLRVIEGRTTPAPLVWTLRGMAAGAVVAISLMGSGKILTIESCII
jgi:hypothetical protein